MDALSGTRCWSEGPSHIVSAASVNAQSGRLAARLVSCCFFVDHCKPVLRFNAGCLIIGKSEQAPMQGRKKRSHFEMWQQSFFWNMPSTDSAAVTSMVSKSLQADISALRLPNWGHFTLKVTALIFMSFLAACHIKQNRIVSRLRRKDSSLNMLMPLR